VTVGEITHRAPDEEAAARRLFHFRYDTDGTAVPGRGEPMTHTTPRIIVLAAACAMAAVAALPLALAQEASRSADEAGPPHPAPAPSSPKPFEELDANGDGAISKDEAAIDPPLAQAFGTLDADADGRLTPTEYAAYAQGQS
jgi:hypothetical protein